MVTVTVIAEAPASRARYLSSKKLPLRYMEDFTLMGFVVDRLAQAKALLVSHGFCVEEQHQGIEVIISDYRGVAEINSLFAENNIHSTYGDIAETMYQA